MIEFMSSVTTYADLLEFDMSKVDCEAWAFDEKKSGNGLAYYFIYDLITGWNKESILVVPQTRLNYCNACGAKIC